MQAFVARQPILDTSKTVFGYELLFRSGLENAFGDVDGDTASNRVISDTLLTIGMPSLTSGGKAFINFTRNTLLSGYANLLPREAAVIEILEDVEPTPDILDACSKLKEAGYTLAVDDVVKPGAVRPFLEFVDIIKVDICAASDYACQACAQEFGEGRLLLAEKVETEEDFERTREMGYNLFQGYFFSKPVVVSHRRVDQNQPMRLALLAAVNEQEVDFIELEEIIKKDVGLTYRLMKYINSSYFGLREEVSSIRQAVTLLGHRNIRRWTSLIALEALSENKPAALLQESLVRAQFCELVGELIGMNDSLEDLFLLGMFSLIDAILDRPMEDILKDIPLHDELRLALLPDGKPNKLRDVLKLVISYERGEWAAFNTLKGRFGFDEDTLPDLYVTALNRVREIQSSDGETAGTSP